MTPEDDDEPKTVNEALTGPAKDHWRKAMEEEIESMRINGVWDLVDLPKGRRWEQVGSQNQEEGCYVLLRGIRLGWWLRAGPPEFANKPFVPVGEISLTNSEIPY